MALYYVEETPVVEARADMAVLTVSSGDDTFAFALTINALYRLTEGARQASMELCETTRGAFVIDMPTKRRKTR